MKTRFENSQIRDALEKTGLILLSTLPLKMKVSSEACNAVFFVKSSFLNQPVDLCANMNHIEEEWKECIPFWNIDTLLPSLEELEDSIIETLDTDKFGRKIKKLRFITIDL
jgi:hypothetical protein